ncbi:unnamed protein product [Caenorhabditis auriculariae]|uniref:Uncharacterized protein n=1 Tax=Caenorhabditis auriculariae TaxID=2777116 RepID=A0A8S1HPE3_9PELO|nr:unnamed protein product [Caenorhabditis auriculariae]
MSEPATSTARARLKLKPLEFTPLAPESTFQYADLNIVHTGNIENTISMVRRAIRMGYDAVAINIDIGDIAEYQTEPGADVQLEASEEPPKKKKKKGGSENLGIKKQLPKPFYVDQSKLDLNDLKKRGKVFRQFSRITFTANAQVVLNKTFNHPRILDFDLVAVRPGNDSVIETLSRKVEHFDIITVQANEQTRWLSGTKILERIRGEGIFYELNYAEALSDRNTRQISLFNGRVLLRAMRSRGVLMSSGARQMIDLRAPVDVMNLAFLWGVTNANARNLISGHPKAVLLQAECRGTENGEVHSMPLSSAEVGESEDSAKDDEPMETSQEDAVKKPPVEVQLNMLQYERLLKATKKAHQMVKSIRETKTATQESAESMETS